jgi:twitching motility two-component system response regulator PilG
MRGTQRGFRNGSDVSFPDLGLDRSNRAHHTVPVSATTGVDTVSIPSSGLKVLVIDDSNTIRRSAEIFLKQGGHDVMLAEDGFDALSKVNDYEPNLIFCDILMPRLDGYQTCAIIKRNARFSDVPIVMLSSKDGVFDKARGRMVGSQDYLTKPFTKDQLLQTVLALGTVKQREE